MLQWSTQRRTSLSITGAPQTRDVAEMALPDYYSVLYYARGHAYSRADCTLVLLKHLWNFFLLLTLHQKTHTVRCRKCFCHEAELSPRKATALLLLTGEIAGACVHSGTPVYLLTLTRQATNSYFRTRQTMVDVLKYAPMTFQDVLKQRRIKVEPELLRKLTVAMNLDALQQAAELRTRLIPRIDESRKCRICRREIARLSRGFAHKIAEVADNHGVDTITGEILADAFKSWRDGNAYRELSGRYALSTDDKCVDNLASLS